MSRTATAPRRRTAAAAGPTSTAQPCTQEQMWSGMFDKFDLQRSSVDGTSRGPERKPSSSSDNTGHPVTSDTGSAEGLPVQENGALYSDEAVDECVKLIMGQSGTEDTVTMLPDAHSSDSGASAASDCYTVEEPADNYVEAVPHQQGSVTSASSSAPNAVSQPAAANAERPTAELFTNAVFNVARVPDVQRAVDKAFKSDHCCRELVNRICRHGHGERDRLEGSPGQQGLRQEMKKSEAAEGSLLSAIIGVARKILDRLTRLARDLSSAAQAILGQLISQIRDILGSWTRRSPGGDTTEGNEGAPDDGSLLVENLVRIVACAALVILASATFGVPVWAAGAGCVVGSYIVAMRRIYALWLRGVYTGAITGPLQRACSISARLSRRAWAERAQPE